MRSTSLQRVKVLLLWLDARLCSSRLPWSGRLVLQGPGVLVGTLRPHFPAPYQLLTLDYLWLDSNTGGLYTTERRLDREELCPEETRVDGCIIPHTAIVGADADLVQFSLIVEDINDNAPHFENTEIHLSLSEDVIIGAAFLLDDLAQDRDIGSNGLIHYIIEGSDGVFDVDAEDGGGIKLVVKAALDRETRAEYNTSLVAKDGGSPSFTAAAALRITVTDVNDNCPSFSPDSRQNVTISGDSPKNTLVAQVKATDPDFGTNSVITYDFSPKDMVLKVLAHGPHCSPADTQVTVSVLPRAKQEPTIKMGFIARHENQALMIPENEPSTLLAVLELEAEQGLEELSLDIEGEGPFALSRQRGTYLLSTSTPLDYEQKTEHNITVCVLRSDRGSVITASARVIRVVVTDVNDNAPIFPVSVYETEVEENNPPGRLLQVTASDADSQDNGRVTYRLGQHTDRMFNIDPYTGQLFVSVSLDREQQTLHIIRVTAQDNGVPLLETTVTVRIRVLDKNDNAPVFVMPHFIFFVPENTPVLAPVGALGATDADEGENGTIVLYVANSSGPFVIPNSKNTLHTTASLDREQQDHFEFWVIASDQGAPKRLSSSVRITVYIEDINDNKPKVMLPVSNLTCLTVAPDTSAGTTIARVYAVDRDTGLNSELTYTILNQSGPFKVDSKTGNITLAQRLQRPDLRMHNLFVVVSDRGKPAPLHTAVWVNLFVNDSLETCHLDCEPQEPPWPSPTTSESVGCPASPAANSPNPFDVMQSRKKTFVNRNENEVPLKLQDKYYSDE
uniref:Cadherin domain-containing protein n=1 Tax=Periophthalmus magnuspinnatus TaxID=409849 RepID=A0A3B3ZE05_9GOBI